MSPTVPPPPLGPPRIPRVPRRSRLSTWYRARSLRSRFALLTAAAVAVAIAASALACWFIVEKQIYGVVRSDLENVREGGQPAQLDDCSPNLQSALKTVQGTAPQPPSGGSAPRDTQYVIPGQTPLYCLPLMAAKAIAPDPGDTAVLSLRPNQFIIREGHYTNGEPALVRVSWTKPKALPPTLVMVATSTKAVNESLNRLAFVLGGVALGGVILAAVAGRLVARSALKPVDQLTDAVEHIARTDEVGTTIPVHGEDEIARLSTSFNSMSTALANSRERQTRLIADAYHELRTPLTSLRTNVDLLIRSDDTGRPLPPATRTKLLGNMKAQMQELTVLIGDLLQLSRPDSPSRSARSPWWPCTRSPNGRSSAPSCAARGWCSRPPPRPGSSTPTPCGLERAVINLLDNAVKYSPPGGTIAVRLDGGVLTVRDHGPGIPQDELPYVFDRFWRSPSSRQLPGSGLGLSIVAQSVREAGGEVSLGPARDGGPGALATVRLPGGPSPD